ncbi:MAG TPA: prepilin-type N-terminal cleavage/methylation domain-containing protein [Kiritimatiellia bacterium]|nr:prepilin-type N-terminal cleavage/methylation domain-containing protein [Kiritimatiellia bacterium]HRZ13330.1 prepilin-type N-terminal cleavage/methylation domain-containing protein [Kiritimatiellia bacterium]HSA18779.1 prepilin-type N-terminal cleavage/methylation domain-containing protein [Kiritimatiellia bacterium]
MRRGPRRRRAGFTFLEAIIALAVAALLVTVSASSLASVFRADRTAERLFEATLLLRAAAAGEYLGAPLEDLPEAWPAGWQLQAEQVETGKEPMRWKVLQVLSDEIALASAFRQP